MTSVPFGDSQWVTSMRKLHTTETRMKCMLIFIRRLSTSRFHLMSLISKHKGEYAYTYKILH